MNTNFLLNIFTNSKRVYYLSQVDHKALIDLIVITSHNTCIYHETTPSRSDPPDPVHLTGADEPGRATRPDSTRYDPT